MGHIIIAVFLLLLCNCARADSTLIGGSAAPAAEWPASVYARMGNSACSATVVGERTLLIASHCVNNGGTARFSVLSNQYQATCNHAPGYPRNSTYDWTLCLIDRKVTGIKYESLADSSEGVRIGAELRLTGYGCIRSGGGGGNDGIFRIGKAPVIALPGGSDADIVTRGSAALCYGDSGGAAYLESADGSRKIVGVNSRGNISTTSYLPALYHPQMKTFIATWAATKLQRICGIHSDAKDCRDEETPPDPDPTPPDCKEELAAFEQYFNLLKACLKSQEL